MRITNNMLAYNYLISLNKSLQRQHEIQEQLADGKAIHRPSDDPVKTIRSLRFNTNLAMNEQFTQNLKDAISWMESSDSALSNMGDILIRAKELVIRAVGPNPDIALETAGKELDGLINQLIDLTNTQLGDRFIFAGQKDKTQPVVRNGDMVQYLGDNLKISMPIQPGSVNPDRDSVNLTGLDLFGQGEAVDGLKLFENLIYIKNELLKGDDANMDFLSKDAIAWIDSGHDRLLQAQTELGTRYSMYELAQRMLEDNYVTITGDIAANEDIDMAKAIIDFKNSENVYRAALAVGARVMPVSLVDFLR